MLSQASPFVFLLVFWHTGGFVFFFFLLFFLLAFSSWVSFVVSLSVFFTLLVVILVFWDFGAFMVCSSFPSFCICTFCVRFALCFCCFISVLVVVLPRVFVSSCSVVPRAAGTCVWMSLMLSFGLLTSLGFCWLGSYCCGCSFFGPCVVFPGFGVWFCGCLAF